MYIQWELILAEDYNTKKTKRKKTNKRTRNREKEKQNPETGTGEEFLEFFEALWRRISSLILYLSGYTGKRYSFIKLFVLVLAIFMSASMVFTLPSKLIKCFFINYYYFMKKTK